MTDVSRINLASELMKVEVIFYQADGSKRILTFIDLDEVVDPPGRSDEVYNSLTFSLSDQSRLYEFDLHIGFDKEKRCNMATFRPRKET